MSYNTSNFAGDSSAQSALDVLGQPMTGSTGAASSRGSRLANSGLAPGANGLLTDIAGSVFSVNFNGTDGSPIKPEYDWRVRISMAKPTADLFYNRIDTEDKSRKIGVIAQEVQEVLPEVVSTNEDTLSVAYGNIVGVLIEAIKEQQTQIEELKTLIHGLTK